MAKKTGVRRRSNQTPLPLPLPLRRSLRFLTERNDQEEESATITGKSKTHLLFQSPSISPKPINAKTHQRQGQGKCSTKCQNERGFVRRSPRLAPSIVYSATAAANESSGIRLGKFGETERKSNTTRRRSPRLLASLLISDASSSSAAGASKVVNVGIGGWSNVGNDCLQPREPRGRRRSIRLMGSAKEISVEDEDGVRGRLSDEKDEGTREVKDNRKQPQKEKEEEMGADGSHEGKGNTLMKRVRRDREVNSESAQRRKKKRMNIEKICKENTRNKEEEEEEEEEEKEVEKCVGFEGWTKEQEAALNRAYLVAKPSPHFWKKVSKMVPGKSAQDCFDRVNGSLETPPQPQPRSRSCRSNLSPIGSFSLSGNKSSQPAVPLTKRLSSRKKTLVAQKTVRHLLKKHCLTDQSHEADYFSVLETSPIALAVEISEIRSPGAPDCIPNQLSLLQKCSGGSSAHQKLMSRFKPSSQTNHPSPEVLKKIKNVKLHEKYIDQLHCREVRRKFAKTASTVVTKDGKNDGELKSIVLKAAKTALMSDARDAISEFQHMQANNANVNINDAADDEYDVDNFGGSDKDDIEDDIGIE